MADRHSSIVRGSGVGPPGGYPPFRCKNPLGPPARPGVEASGRTSLPILGAVGGEVAGHCFRPVFEGLGEQRLKP